jgi:hydrogenase-4 component F
VSVLLSIVLGPALLAVLGFALPSDRLRPLLLPLGGVLHLGLVAAALTLDWPPMLGGWVALDALGKLFLLFVSVLYCLLSIYAPGYLAQRAERPNRIFVACLLLFPGWASLVLLAQHLGLMWVALEATTLTTAPLLYFNRTARSLEAVWKYLLIGSVGIALALLGSLFLAYAELHESLRASLLLSDLERIAPSLSRPWLHAAFVVLFIGYGTKMGLAPMHTWKPDAYGEAPGLVGALLAGASTSCAFLAILRTFHVCVAAGDAGFARDLMVAFGLFSMAVAAIFMARQRDYKRLLAYSSVEHMGILVLGVGVGGNATFGALLHLVNNGLTKGVLFLSAANIHRAYGSKSIEQTTGALKVVPFSAALFLLGFIAVTGSPPFGPFVSEFTILDAAIGGGRYGVVAAFLGLLVIIFTGMSATVLAVVQGPAPVRTAPPGRPETFFTIAPVAVFLALSLLLGVYLPPRLEGLIRDAARIGVAP